MSTKIDATVDADDQAIVALEQASKTVVIPPKANRTQSRSYDTELYKARHLVENVFAKLKQFRAIATRHDKRGINFLAGIDLASTIIWLDRGHALVFRLRRLGNVPPVSKH